MIAQFIEAKNLEGCFVECGVKYGTTAIVMVKELKCKGFLFDTWCRFEGLSKIDGPPKMLNFVKKRNGRPIKKLCQQALKKHGVEHLCKMIQGDARKTVVEWVKENGQTIKMIQLDMDVYEPTKVCLNLLWPYLHAKGMIFVHDYGSKKWKGIIKSVNEFNSEHPSVVVPYNDIKACLISHKEIENETRQLVAICEQSSV